MLRNDRNIVLLDIVDLLNLPEVTEPRILLETVMEVGKRYHSELLLYDKGDTLIKKYDMAAGEEDECHQETQQLHAYFSEHIPFLKCEYTNQTVAGN